MAGETDCPIPEVIQGFVARTLAGGQVAQIEAHIASCDACRMVASALAKEAYSGGSTTQAAQAPGGASDVLQRGATVGRYVVLSLLGRGGMGDVYVAYDAELDRRIALKLLHTGSSTPAARQRLMREARGLGRLSHPHVVQCHDVGEHNGDVFIAMELVEGETLGAWARHSPPPNWEDVLSAYLDAGRGLAAAHDRGLVHRDVKPSNLVRGKDGRVRVVDFGLVAESEPSSRPGAGPGEGPSAWVGLDEPPRGGGLTAAGAVLGTPLYMAPEQFEGARVGPASDQYALCVSLYEALYGCLPFAASPRASTPTELARLAEQKKAAPAPTPPAGSAVPTRVYKALLTGLKARPEERYPSMSELLRALSADPAARRQRFWLATGVLATAFALAAVAGVAWRTHRPVADPCAHREEELRGVWDDGVQARIRSTFADTRRPYAKRSLEATTAALDTYAREWAAVRREVCKASLAAAPLTELLLARQVCLDHRLSRLRALTRLLGAKPDVSVLDKAVSASAELPPIADCNDIEALSSRVRPPESPSLRARVAQLEPRVDELATLYTLAKYQEASASGESILQEAKDVPYAPILARTQYELGRLHAKLGDDEKAKVLLRDAAALAAQSGDDVLVANAWMQVLYVVGERQRHFDEASFILSLGPTVLGRAHDATAEARWLNMEGLALYRMGRYAQAKSALQRARALDEEKLSPEHPRLLQTLSNLGLVLRELGESREAVSVYERVLAARERTLGPEHPDVATALNNLGMVLFDQGEFARAKQVDQRAVSIREKVLGPNNRDVSLPLNNLGDVCFQTGDYAAAKALHERALAIREAALGAAHPDVAQSLSNLGVVSYEMGDFVRARVQQERALAILEKSLPPNHPDLAYPLVGLGRALTRLHQEDAARRDLERALTLRQGATSPSELAEPLLGLGELELASQKPEAAAALLEKALATGDSHVDGDVRLALADALWRLGKDRGRGVELVVDAHAAYERIGHRAGADRTARWLASHPLTVPVRLPRGL
jgi:tetratricopeptide (TPR) repeat protein